MMLDRKKQFRSLSVAALLLLGACSGVEVIPESTDSFESAAYTRYAWRSESPSQTASGKDTLPIISPIVRASVEERLQALGYRRVAREDAEFLVEYLATIGYNEGQVERMSSNAVLYPSSVNRQVDGASIDNAQALGGVVETRHLMLVFVDAKSTESLWRVQVSTVVHDTNRIDEGEVRSAVLKGLAALPPASPAQ